MASPEFSLPVLPCSDRWSCAENEIHEAKNRLGSVVPAVNRERQLRSFLIDTAFGVAEDLPEILSLNIVGTFAESDDLSGISDIDVVIILDHLTEWKFKEISET